MTEGLVDRPGKWRNVNAQVPSLMKGLFDWLADSEDPVLIKSCVFHFEFEFIHPFPDGNGRTGRLWQTALLGSWRNEFYGVPVENIVWAHQQEYYAAIREASARGDAGPFIDFMLDKILRTLKAKGQAYEAEGREKSRVKGREKSREKILRLLKEQPELTQADLANALGLSIKAIEKNIKLLKDAKQLRRIGPDKGGRWEVI